MTTRPASDLRYVEAADVWKGDRLAGQLHRSGNDIVFRYDDGYRADRRAPALAWAVPKSVPEVRSTGGSVPPFFAGLLPEGVRLRAVVTGTRTSEDDHLTLLLAVGQDAVGDVRVLPADTAPVEPSATFDEREAETADLDQLFRALASPDGLSLDPRALPGVQPKVSAAMMSAAKLRAPVRTASGPAVLKLNPPEGYPHLVENEAFFLDLAHRCGLPTPPHRLVRDRLGRSGLLVARFDRVRGPDGSTRLAQEDACQVLDVFPANKYRLNTEQVMRALAEAVALGDGSGPLALRRLFELVAFSYLIGNGDLHGKNFSIRRSPTGSWEVTPVYDLVCTQPYLSWRDPMALPLFGRANRLTRGHLLEAAARLGLPARALVSALDRICAAVPPALDGLGGIGFDERTTQRLADLLRHRLGELQGDVR